MKHIIERVLTGALLIWSITQACYGHWPLASYLLFMAAFLDFDDWTARH